MNQFLRIPGISLKMFFLGTFIGFTVASIMPQLGQIYFSFQLQQAEHLATVQMGPIGSIWLAFTILLRNCLIALLMAFLPVMLVYQTLAYRKRYPYKSGDPDQKLKDEIRLTLTLYSVAILFAYGFFVFGFFLAYVFIQDSFLGLARWMLYLLPHGILETLAMIISASTGIAIRDGWLKDFVPTISGCWKNVSRRDYAICLVFLSGLLFVSAFVEVYVSGDLMRFLVDYT